MKFTNLGISILLAVVALSGAIAVAILEHVPLFVFIIIAACGAQLYAVLLVWVGNVSTKHHIAQLEKIERDEQQRAEQFFDLLGDFVGEDDMELLKQKWAGNGE
jgi:membrane protein DedA with SNARE-associated domain